MPKKILANINNLWIITTKLSTFMKRKIMANNQFIMAILLMILGMYINIKAFILML